MTQVGSRTGAPVIPERLQTVYAQPRLCKHLQQAVITEEGKCRPVKMTIATSLKVAQQQKATLAMLHAVCAPRLVKADGKFSAAGTVSFDSECPANSLD